MTSRYRDWQRAASRLRKGRCSPNLVVECNFDATPDPELGRGEKRPIPELATEQLIVVEPVADGASIASTRSEVMARVRSVVTLCQTLAAAHASALVRRAHFIRTITVRLEETRKNRDRPRNVHDRSLMAGTVHRIVGLTFWAKSRILVREETEVFAHGRFRRVHWVRARRRQLCSCFSSRAMIAMTERSTRGIGPMRH